MSETKNSVGTIGTGDEEDDPNLLHSLRSLLEQNEYDANLFTEEHNKPIWEATTTELLQFWKGAYDEYQDFEYANPTIPAEYVRYIKYEVFEEGFYPPPQEDENDDLEDVDRDESQEDGPQEEDSVDLEDESYEEEYKMEKFVDPKDMPRRTKAVVTIITHQNQLKAQIVRSNKHTSALTGDALWMEEFVNWFNNLDDTNAVKKAAVIWVCKPDNEYKTARIGRTAKRRFESIAKKNQWWQGAKYVKTRNRNLETGCPKEA